MREKIADIIRNNQNGDTDWDEMLDQLCDLYIVVQRSELLKGKYTKDFEDWLLGFEKENEKYIVDDEQINTKEEMYDLYREL